MRNEYTNDEEGENSLSDQSEEVSQSEFNTEQSGGVLTTIPETDREYNEESVYMSNHVETVKSARDVTTAREKEVEEKIEEVSEKGEKEEDKEELNVIKQEKKTTPSPKMKKLEFSKLTQHLDTEGIASTATKTSREEKHNLIILPQPSEKYHGEVDENYVRNGYGIYHYENGDIYEGEFIEGLRHGEGEYLYSDGSIYRGNWEHDQKHGKGTFKFEQYEFDGEWAHDTLLSGFTFKINSFNRNNSIDEDDEYEEDSSISNIDNRVYSSSYSSDEENLRHEKLVEVDQFDEDNLKDFIQRNKKRFETYKVDIELVNIKNHGTKVNLINNILDNRTSDFDWTDESTPSSISHHDHQCAFHKYYNDSLLEDKCEFKCNCKKIRRSSLLTTTNKLFLTNFNSSN